MNDRKYIDLEGRRAEVVAMLQVMQMKSVPHVFVPNTNIEITNTHITTITETKPTSAERYGS